MAVHFADRLLEAVRTRGNAACVGLDPLPDRLPPGLRRADGEPAETQAETADRLRRFCADVIEIVAPHVPVVKINIAFFEPFHAEGFAAYDAVVGEARRAGLLVIGDVKRGDIGHSTERYAVAHLEDRPERRGATVDAVTVSPYLGFDAVEPFARVGARNGRGVFVLVQTSNESARRIQALALADGGTVGEAVGREVESWASDPELIGASGYSAIGAVVSPRDVPATDRLRALMPHCVFLVPGFGAQGRTAEDVAHCFKPDGTGAIVNASRSVIFAFDRPEYRSRFGSDWKSAVREACVEFAGQVRGVMSRTA